MDELVVRAPGHGWSLLFADRHPHAGGPGHCAGYLENTDGFEVELVAAPPVGAEPVGAEPVDAASDE